MKSSRSRLVFAAATWLALLLFFAPVAQTVEVELSEVLDRQGVSGIDLSPDGKWVSFLRRGKTGSRLAVVATGDRTVRELASGGSGKWASDSKRLAFLKSTPKGRQLAVVDLTGSVRQLTTQVLGIKQFAWSPDGRWIAFVVERSPEKLAHHPVLVGIDDQPRGELWIVDTESGDVRPIPVEGSVGGFDLWFSDTIGWSPDSRQIGFSLRPHGGAGSHLDADIAVADRETGSVVRVVQRPGMDVYPQWSPDGRRLAFITTQGRRDWVTGSAIEVIDLGSGQIETVSRGYDDKIKEFLWKPDGSGFCFLAPRGVRSALFEIDLKEQTVRERGAEGQHLTDLSIARDGSYAFLSQTAHTPPDIVWVRPDESAWRTLTQSAESIARWPKITVRVMRWRSFDGLEIEGLLWLPANSEQGRRLPLLVSLHGGPHGLDQLTFQGGNGLPEARWLVWKGWAVFQPNFRGSSGYGEDFLRANLEDWGGGDYRDVMSGVDRLIADGIVDPERMAITGQSYGGYLSTWATTQTQRFKAAIVGCSIVDVPSFVRTSDVPERFEHYLGSDPRKYARHSPSTFIDDVRTPTLIWHGGLDERVPPSQSRFLYTALRRNGSPVVFVLYPGLNHGLVGAEVVKDLVRRRMQWLEKYVTGAVKN